jgi:hypothetical protein
MKVNWLTFLAPGCALGAIMVCGGSASCRGLIPLSGLGQFDATAYNYVDVLKGIGLTSLRVGIFYGRGDIRVEDVVALGRNNILLFQDFSSFVHHRKTDMKDAYVSGVIGIGFPKMEFLTFGLETNLGTSTRFKQYTDAANLSVPYRAALGVLALNNDEAGSITLNNKNRYWAFDACGKLPAFPGVDILAGYKWVWITSKIDPYSADSPANAHPVFPGQAGWTPSWATAQTSGTSFDMHQNIAWNGPFMGLRLSETSGYGFEWFLDTRLYPWLFGNYKFSWNGAYLDPFANFTPGIYGSQSTNISGTNRWGAEVDFRCRRSLRSAGTIEFEARYSYAAMSGSCLEYQTLGNVYGSSSSPYWGAANYAQNTPESLSIRQQLWTVGGSLEMAF